MGSTVGGVVGAVIGFVVTMGNPAGAQIGFMIGSAIGGAIKPQQIQGPKLADTPIQTSREGVPIPIGWGIIHTRGNIIQMNPLKEVETTESQGKGGGAEVTYTDYYRTFAIGVCRSIDGPIAGIRRIWENDKLVYDARAHALYEYENLYDWDFLSGDWDPLWLLLQGPPSWFNAWMWQDADPNTLAIEPKDAALYAAHLMVYYGDEAQMPDAELEAHWGADWTPAFRGLAYIVWNNYKLTTFGAAIPNYRFEVLVNGNGIITSRVYPLEALDQLRIGCSAPFGSITPVPTVDADYGWDLLDNADLRVLLKEYGPHDIDADYGWSLINGGLRQLLRTHDDGHEEADYGWDLIDGSLRVALVSQTVPPEGLQLNCSAPTGSMTSV